MLEITTGMMLEMKKTPVGTTMLEITAGTMLEITTELS